MKLDLDERNVSGLPDQISWKSHSLTLFLSLLLSLYVAWPCSLYMAAFAIVMGTPLIWAAVTVFAKLGTAFGFGAIFGSIGVVLSVYLLDRTLEQIATRFGLM